MATTMARKQKQTVTVDLGGKDGERHLADIVPGESVRLYGTQRVGSEMLGDRPLCYSGDEVPELAGLREWFLALPTAVANEGAALVRAAKTSGRHGTPVAWLGDPISWLVLLDWLRDHDAPALPTKPVQVWTCPISVPIFAEYDRMFRVGDPAEYGSYNLSYYGPIKSISARTVVIFEGAGRERTRRLTVARFDQINRNWDHVQARKRNSEWSD